MGFRIQQCGSIFSFACQPLESLPGIHITWNHTRLTLLISCVFPTQRTWYTWPTLSLNAYQEGFLGPICCLRKLSPESQSYHSIYLNIMYLLSAYGLALLKTPLPGSDHSSRDHIANSEFRVSSFK